MLVIECANSEEFIMLLLISTSDRRYIDAYTLVKPCTQGFYLRSTAHAAAKSLVQASHVIF